MRWYMAGIAVGLGLCACGPSIVDADLDPVCGEARPVRVLALDEGELPTGLGPVQIGDRVYYAVGDAVASDPTDESHPFSLLPRVEHPRVVSTGSCGETPRTIAEGVYAVQEDPRWPGAVLARVPDTDEIVVLDPLGVTPPRLLMHDFEEDGLVRGIVTDVGIVAVVADTPDAATGRLLLQPYPATVDDPPPAQVELLTGVQTPFGSLAAHGTEVLALTETGEILRIDLADGSISTVLEGAIEMLVNFDATWIAFKIAAEPGAPADALPTYVLERSTGTQTRVADASSGWRDVTFHQELVLGLPETSGSSGRVVMIPSLASIDVPAEISLQPFYPRASDGRFIARRGEDYVLYDLERGEAQLLLEGPGRYTFGEDAVDVVDLPLADGPDLFRMTGAWTRVPYATREPELVAHRAAVTRRYLPDGRGLTTVDIDEAFRGTLAVIDPGSLDELHVDEHVYVAGTYADPDAFEDGVIAYTVLDGGRSGVWLAKPASSE
jgi:hypothetical protein